MDGEDVAISRVLVLGAERETRQNVLPALLKLCGQESAADASHGVHQLTLKTKYYTADLEVHVHAVEANELLTPLAHDADQYEALLWVVDAASETSFLETERFVGNSIEELEFDVSLVVGTCAASASLSQLQRLEQWAQANDFEFVAVDDKGDEKQPTPDDPRDETRGMARVKEALECNMWASLQTLDKTTPSAPMKEQSIVQQEEDKEAGGEVEKVSKILVLGAELAEQHAVVQALADRSGGDTMDSPTGETVQALELKTKYYEASVELHLHRVDTNELVTALHHDVAEYEALVWVVDASSESSFKLVQHFVEKSIEELTFDVSLVVGTHVDAASAAQVETLETWCQANAFEFVGVATTESKPPGDDGKQGMDRVLEALHANMWSSMKLLPREAKPTVATVSSTKGPIPAAPVDTATTAPPTAPAPTPTDPTETLSQDERLQASLAAFSAAAGMAPDDGPDMEAFSGLLSQVQRIRESGAVLTDDERRRQAERVAMQLWSMLGSDGDDDDGDSD